MTFPINRVLTQAEIDAGQFLLTGFPTALAQLDEGLTTAVSNLYESFRVLSEGLRAEYDAVVAERDSLRDYIACAELDIKYDA